jgi:hypothetical protein
LILEDALWNYIYAHEAARLEVCLFRPCSLYRNSQGFMEHCAVCCGSPSGLVSMSELSRVCLVLKIVVMIYKFPCAFELLRNTLHIWDTCNT